MDELFATGWLALKIASIIFLFLYTIFAIIVVRQVRLMSETIQLAFDVYIELVAYLHLVVSIVALILAIVLL